MIRCRMINLRKGRLFVSNFRRSYNVLRELRDRGLVSQVSAPEEKLEEQLESGQKVKLYCGVDPTAKSIHLGNLVPLMVLLHFYVRGHDIVTLVGGATGCVGDPSGRTTERSLMEDKTRLSNVSSISGQLEKFFINGLAYYNTKNKDRNETLPGKHIKENNYNWWKDVKMLDFLANYGRHIRVQSMLARDSVTARLNTQNSLGFNEFTYQILQAYDFFHLNKTYGVSIQVGGNDQWGNITAGIDLISRLSSRTKQAYGVTVPLLQTASGEKFGKSAGNAVFIDPSISTPYDIFQFFLNTLDEDVPRFLKTFSFLTIEEIESMTKRHNEKPHLRLGQKMLAKEITDMLFGVGNGDKAQSISNIIFGTMEDKEMKLSGLELIDMFREARILQQAKRGESLVALVSRLTHSSKSEARRKIEQGSIYLHTSRVKITKDINDYNDYLIDDKVLLLRIGKQKCFVIEMQ
ncbi:uncharacterized protein GVI51_H05643 [Nakaseomyces glabratus]|uniref:Tyrosine--tRNA ligase n=2 Tax=Candida glabrata TaxID=5478 RepID=Q6FRU7_CANGA|nr:uncharacterized protein CAGL0H05775g [Nakaseomyces glabratus]KAH7586238.1 Aminoacyl-transfer RNA synthetases class-I signature [Nakaseomyces glabratus]KAH7588397.1 Aminoacyl-transfer RNA synthetases class-I signature [Nakaseomyces glabratus]KAH7592210.1 Aminoacyl-transfer RNA synthetases class-I signature [Nakaseomyces glabratus]KAH7600855.1 Aminoacyl-transfer RNA synthetases class-I signature [Nakaseomyces glabratus]KAH7601475.1 Aminoacyl-transfer RNA synthetases class-I signature [Nakaseo|eukprot:XP_447047.1 uncharacterized protein CAGL0H05775g [[Candida] glabrata]